MIFLLLVLPVLLLGALSTSSSDPDVATESDDDLTGGDGRDVMQGLGGNDRMAGADGNDALFGGAGQDRMTGGRGNDQMWGQGGADRLTDREGADLLAGGVGNDILDAADTEGAASADSLFGGGGDDRLIGNAGDILQGNYIDGTQGNPTRNGSDIYEINLQADRTDPVIIRGLTTARDQILLDLGDLSRNLVLERTADQTGATLSIDGHVRVVIEDLDESFVSLEQFIRPDSGDPRMVITGGSGQTALVPSGAGDETFFGGGDNVSIVGQGGDDLIFLNGGNSQIDATANASVDVVVNRGDATVTGSAAADSLVVRGSTGDTLFYGGDGAEYLTGDRTGAATLFGGEGDDYIEFGQSGQTTLSGDAGADILSSYGPQGPNAAPSQTSTLLGGTGQDQLFGTNSTVMTGGADADYFEVYGFDADPATIATITDFDPATERLVIFTDEPGFGLQVPPVLQAGAVAGQVDVLVGGEVYATLQNIADMNALAGAIRINALFPQS